MTADGHPPSSRCRVRVPPRHCDAQGIVHASRYYEYIEDAFLVWLDDHLGGYATVRSAGVDLVVVASACEHRRGPTLGDLLEIEVRPSAVGRTSLTMTFTFRRDGEALAEGRVTYVTIAAGAPTPLPPTLRAAAGC